jgi:cytoskeletal protein CcmA (bactofilin family)
MNGDVAQTFLVDGFVAGLWRVVKGRVEIEPFGRVPKEVDAEARRLEAWMA